MTQIAMKQAIQMVPKLCESRLEGALSICLFRGTDNAARTAIDRPSHDDIELALAFVCNRDWEAFREHQSCATTSERSRETMTPYLVASVWFAETVLHRPAILTPVKGSKLPWPIVSTVPAIPVPLAAIVSLPIPVPRSVIVAITGARIIAEIQIDALR
jgi:hypothetical protein